MSPRYTRVRRAVQAAFLLLYLALPFLAWERLSGTAVALRIGPVDLLEPAAALSALAAARAAPAVVLLGMVPAILATLLLGSVGCGWVCPFGLASEGLDRLLRRRARWPERSWERARRPRALALAGLLLLSVALGAPLAALLSPPRVATALPLEWVASGVFPAVTVTLLAAFALLDALLPRRLLCRALCPAGAAAAYLRTPLTWRPTLRPERCRCPEAPPCHQACAWGLDPRAMGPLDGCTSCLACVDRCPSGALALLRAPRPGLPPANARR